MVVDFHSQSQIRSYLCTIVGGKNIDYQIEWESADRTCTLSRSHMGMIIQLSLYIFFYTLFICICYIFAPAGSPNKRDHFLGATKGGPLVVWDEFCTQYSRLMSRKWVPRAWRTPWSLDLKDNLQFLMSNGLLRVVFCGPLQGKILRL